jgi:hypothetical protein
MDPETYKRAREIKGTVRRLEMLANDFKADLVYLIDKYPDAPREIIDMVKEYFDQWLNEKTADLQKEFDEL